MARGQLNSDLLPILSASFMMLQNLFLSSLLNLSIHFTFSLKVSLSKPIKGQSPFR